MGDIIVYAFVTFIALAYMVVGTAQVFAIAAGLMRHHAPSWLAYVVGVLIAYLPVVGNAAGVWGAVTAWGWTPMQALIRFGSLMVVIIAIALLG